MVRARQAGVPAARRRERPSSLPIFILLALFAAPSSLAQQYDWSYAFVLRTSYTSSSEIFLNPNSSDPDLRGESSSIGGILGGGAEARMLLPDLSIFLALSVEYNSKESNENLLTAFGGSLQQLPVTEGLRFIPVELTANAYIPLNSETIQVTMGGGLGVYYAARVLRVAGVDAPVVNQPVTAGITVGVGVEYKIWPGVSVEGRMKFRDPEIINDNQFTQDHVDYGGSHVSFPSTPLETKIDVDGMNFMLGMVVVIL